MHCTRVLTLLVLLVGLVQSFKWDIVVGGEKQLEFYYNDTLTHTEVILSANWITSVTYDPVHYRVLFTDNKWPTASISSFDLSTRKIERLFTKETGSYLRVVYDPVTHALYWEERYSIYSFSLNATSCSQADGNLVVTLDNFCRDLTVDSCGGYIFWITDDKIERARLDGSEREVVVDSTVYYRLSLAIDQQTQKIYWTEKTHSTDEQWSIESSNFNGKNRTTLHVVRNTRFAHSLAVSKDFIYWQNFDAQEIWQLPKYSSQTVARKLHSMSSVMCADCRHIATNYTIKEQIQGIKSCDALRGLIPNDLESESTVSVCQNYCFKGECSVSAEGQLTCSCEAGYSGERCEVNACHKHCLNGGVCSLNEEDEPACQCTAGYDGGRCEISSNKDCSSDVGNYGEGKVSACHQFCLNEGTCSLSEASEPVCQCTTDYEGERCEVSVNRDFSIQAACSVSADGQPTVVVNLGQGVHSTCASAIV